MILLTGGTGTLGSELQKHIVCIAPSRRELDITQPIRPQLTQIHNDIQLVVHCAAYTDVTGAEIDRTLCYNTNVIGTRNLAALGIPMLYISTEYVFDGAQGNYSEQDYPNPVNFYALTKLLGEYEAKRTRAVVVRCLFKSRPFRHPAACIDQYTTGDYVDVIGKEIVCTIQKFSELPGTIHIGTTRKSTFELAKQTREVTPTTVASITRVRLPKDTSLNTSLWERLKHGH